MKPEKVSQQRSMTLQLLKQYYDETFILSGGFERTESFQKLRALGPSILPTLIAEFRKGEHIWALLTLMDPWINHPDIPEEARGRYDQIMSLYLRQFEEDGY